MCKDFRESKYGKVAFAVSENANRYNEYGTLNPQMETQEVVWRVNSNLDKEKYGFDVLVTDCDSLVVLVNKYFKVPEDYRPADLVEADGCLMRKAAAEAYIKMRDAAREEGFSIKATSAYRSVEDQARVYKRFSENEFIDDVDETCARPCYSEHHTGLAMDVEGSIKGGRNISKTPEAAWVKENCFKFGFILRYLPETVEITGYASEPWHIRYVGVDVSSEMQEKNIKTLEEYRARGMK